MATAIMEKTKARTETGTEHCEDRRAFFPSPHDPVCDRCGGLMVRESCTDLLNTTGERRFIAKRCVQCGEIVDPVILRNRDLQNRSVLLRPQRSY
jgi:hypothetical protein